MSRKIVLLWLVLLLSGCASWFPQSQNKQTGSVVDYLYAGKQTAMQPEVTTLRLPLRVGIAFVPSQHWGQAGSSEEERLRLLEQVKAAFGGHEFISAIEVIPTTYLSPKGGFANLEQVARMFNVDVVTLLSYDQVQFNDSNALSVLYWTIVGAYVIHGDQYDVHTMLDASVIDVASRKLLFRAPGVSNVKGGASLASFTERSRAARAEGYNQALAQLIPNLQAELGKFRERVKNKQAPQVRVEYREGYRGGGGDLGLLGLGLLAGLLGWARFARTRAARG